MTIDPGFPPTRAHALQRLADFVPHAGAAYAQHRNADYGPGARSAVSRLSPYIRHRLITEREVVAAVLARHRYADAEKFIQEVLWRTYWKGWLELRPAIWQRYLATRDADRATLADDRAVHQAENGLTGIDGFDDWARELRETGYLHNHARMWFASIWIFTLRLPWALGADFFMRHLADADPASNTLSWRWVAGLQTVGKTYLATADNIARYTQGRFSPKGLATHATALTEPPVPAARRLPAPADVADQGPALLLVTAEDASPETLFPHTGHVAGVIIATSGDNDRSSRFFAAAIGDTASRLAAHYHCPVQTGLTLEADTLADAAHDAGVDHLVTAYAPVGAVADRLAAITPALADRGVTLGMRRRGWDDRFWPHATRGFFPFKERIPALIDQELADDPGTPVQGSLWDDGKRWSG